MSAKAEQIQPATQSKINGTHLWLSILLPVYNVEEFLRPCVVSILTQNPGSGVEIILLDDCSTDGSRALSQQLCAEFPAQLRLIQHKNNRGLSAARNTLLGAARGEYVWFIDSDDYLLPGAVQSLQHIIKNHAPDMVLCDYRKRRFVRKKSFPGLGKKFEHSKRTLVRGVFANRKMYSWLKISRRCLWGDDLRFPEGRAFEDIATTPKLALRAASYYYVPQTWLHYRTRPGSIMTSFSRTKGFFDAAKHKDMAQAMLGFKHLMYAALGAKDGQLNFAASNFIATEYAKLAARYKSVYAGETVFSGGSPCLYSYYEIMQECSPYDFGTLQREYLKRLSLIRYFNLRRAVRLAHVYDHRGR